MEHDSSDFGDTYEPFETGERYRAFMEERRREERRATIILWALALLGIAAIVVTSVLDAEAHDAPSGVWSYPPACCRGTSVGGDCDEIPASAVREGPDGYEVSLTQSDHPMVYGTVRFVVPYADARTSPDNEYHVCLRRNMTPICFFAGARGL